MLISKIILIFTVSKETKIKIMKIPKINGVTFLRVELVFHCIVERDLYDFGSITLENDGRNYILDIVRSESTNDNNHTIIQCDVETDGDIFPLSDEFNYKLNITDLLDENLSSTIYIGEEYEIAPDSLTLFVQIAHMTKAIDLIID